MTRSSSSRCSFQNDSLTGMVLYFHRFLELFLQLAKLAVQMRLYRPLDLALTFQPRVVVWCLGLALVLISIAARLAIVTGLVGRQIYFIGVIIWLGNLA